MKLKSWSYDSFIPPVTPYGNGGQGCYYLMYVRGIEDKDKKHKFWIEVEVSLIRM